MFSARKTILLSAIASIALAQGCGGKAENAAHKTGETMYDAVNISSRQGDSPVRESAELSTPDAAMEKRQWPESISYIPNGATVAGPTGFAYEPRRDQNKYKFYYADTGNFFLNLVTMPYTLWKNPPLSEQTFPGERMNPTYTAVPPLPAEQAAEPTPMPAETPAPTETPAPSETPTPPAETPAVSPAPAETPATPTEVPPPAPPTTQP